MLRPRQFCAIASVLALVLFANCGFTDDKPAVKASEGTKGKEAKAAEKKSGAMQVDKDLPEYKPVAGITGSLRSAGSDTMNNVMNAWCEGFKKHYPSVTFAVEGKGSGTAMPALESGAATFGCLSRDPNAAEVTSFQKKFGYKPTTVNSSLDMLAVFVNKDNPIKGLTLAQVDAMYSSTRKLGGKEDITKWGQLGLKDEWEKEPIALYGRDSASGTYGFFKEHVLGKGDFKDSVKVQSGSSGVISAVAGEKFGVGYSGIGYATADVRAVPLSKDDSGQFVAAEPQNAYSGKYPLWRPLLLAVNRDPTKELDPLRREFIKYVLSKEGQQEVVDNGFLPLPAKAAKKALADAGIK
jgi:phosphate transport system substrate-binding protein